MRQFFRTALENITRHGDTDMLPFPLERHIFFDNMDRACDILEAIHADFDGALQRMPLDHEDVLSAAGYNGFRRGTQIDPIWNAYFLALVLSISEDIEKARIPTDKQTVYSYRVKPDPGEKTFFDRDLGWVAWQRRSMELANQHSHVLVCDIADFYPRIYHHRLENALQKASTNTESIRRIMTLLFLLSKRVSYGLPVGGPAARLLAEILLNRVDRLLVLNRVVFCRFVDDYHVFARSREEAYEHLVFLCGKLLDNEGLSLQKSKTQVLTAPEFLSTVDLADETQSETPEQTEARAFLSLQLHYDPYSETAEQDYIALRDELTKFDVVGMLAREVQKTRIDQPITKKLISAISHLSKASQNAAAVSLIENLPVLYPVFPKVMMVLRDITEALDAPTREAVFAAVRSLVLQESYITRVPANLAFAIRLLARDRSDEADEVLARVFAKKPSKIVTRDIILSMAARDAHYWISDLLKHYSELTLWDRRALLVASYILGDEGDHWRKSVRDSLSEMDRLVANWAAAKKNSGKWDLLL